MFTKNNKLAIGNSGGGRPKSKVANYKKKISENIPEAEKSFRFLCKIRDSEN